MNPKQLRRARKFLRNVKRHPEKADIFQSKVTELGKTLTPEVKLRFEKSYGVKF